MALRLQSGVDALTTPRRRVPGTIGPADAMRYPLRGDRDGRMHDYVRGGGMAVVAELLANNERYAAEFAWGELPRPPSRPLAIITCLDGRINPLAILGLGIGEANVIRNAGGRVAEAIRSLAISQHLLGTREIIVMHHTDCGLLSFTSEAIRRRVADNLGPAAGKQAEAIDFLEMPDLEESLRADVELLRSSPLLFPETVVTGLIYDVHTGRVREVEREGWRVEGLEDGR